MSECGTSIVECLITKGIEPVATSSNELSDRPASNALIYTKEPMFHTSHEGPNPWWKIDFRREVTILSYQIETYAYYAHINMWNISVSNDNRNWRIADSQPDAGYPCGNTYTMNRTSSARYLKVIKLKNISQGNEMAMCYIKFFGSIYSALPGKLCTQQRKNSVASNIVFLISLIKR